MSCLNCGEEAKYKFCGSSCSASYNNAQRVSKRKVKHCLHCSVEIDGKGAKYCSLAHQQEYQYQQRVQNWKNGDKIGKGPLKRYLSEKKDGCWSCGITEWNSKAIVLELEHVDGNSQNDTEPNLSLICPNCHSQTDTYKGKNMGNGRHYRRVRYAEGKSF